MCISTVRPYWRDYNAICAAPEELAAVLGSRTPRTSRVYIFLLYKFEYTIPQYIKPSAMKRLSGICRFNANRLCVCKCRDGFNMADAVSDILALPQTHIDKHPYVTLRLYICAEIRAELAGSVLNGETREGAQWLRSSLISTGHPMRTDEFMKLFPGPYATVSRITAPGPDIGFPLHTLSVGLSPGLNTVGHPEAWFVFTTAARLSGVDTNDITRIKLPDNEYVVALGSDTYSAKRVFARALVRD